MGGEVVTTSQHLRREGGVPVGSPPRPGAKPRRPGDGTTTHPHASKARPVTL
ncbi:hypothetical protein SISNIDRAFT_147040 [Sistotremastrum niveocremeum HHB9708]|uniref:Uncharacterized protein n=1 Tax=Sistotremastrum niveocremeum HHB9708 TaxID=1314777 RepID=A0A165A633_9AGAM|nr:hypothetical protein SISNIDRAFT_147040 [Sistotremastrum niveocremeum HHB9708]